MSSGAVIDSSVLVAVLIGEPEAGVMLDVLSGLEQCRISAVNVLEASTVMASRRGSGGVAGLRSLFDVSTSRWRRSPPIMPPWLLTHGEPMARGVTPPV